MQAEAGGAVPDATATTVPNLVDEGHALVDPLTDKDFDAYIRSHPIVMVK